jgi:membrane-bound lytic murein transglycosylase A
MRWIVLMSVAAAVFAGCQKPKQTQPDYNRPLRPGELALQKVTDPADWPNLERAFATADERLVTALDRSVEWFTAPSAREHYPVAGVDFNRARASTYALRQLVVEADTPQGFHRRVREQFDCYRSVGYDGMASVLYTGYFTPIFRGSRTQTDACGDPLYAKPDDLAIDPLTGEVLGRKTPSGHEPYPARAELENSGELSGLEIVYVPSRLDQYIIHVNGSAKIELPDGSSMRVGYAGSNGREYTGLGATLIEEGVLAAERVSLAAIRAHFADKPDELERYIHRNDRFIFFREYERGDWPAGSLGLEVTAGRSLATDKQVFPRACPVVASVAEVPTEAGRTSWTRLMVDQDTGGAIRAAGRADIYFGIGAAAERRAGRQFSVGRLDYLLLKHDRVGAWLDRMAERDAAAR